MEQYQLFEVKEKVGMFRPDIYYIHGEYTAKHGEVLYKVGWGESAVLRAIGVISDALLREAIDKGVVVLLGKRKVTKADEKKREGAIIDK